MQRFLLGVFCLTISLGEAQNVEKPTIYNYHVTSEIRSRFATTLVSSRVLNSANDAQEVIFNVQLPIAAYISNFTMEIDGEVTVGEVKEKEKTRQQFQTAKSKSQSAGLNAQKPRETNEFEISVNISAKGKVTFNLTYQEILPRVHGVYRNVINLNPGEIVENLNVDLFVYENAEITDFFVPAIAPKLADSANEKLKQAKGASDVSIDKNISAILSVVHVRYSPNKLVQKSFSEQGIGAQLVALYDVRRNLSGDVEVSDGYFVHFFAPDELPVGAKHIVFVLDKSSSMQGEKIRQLKDAMGKILDDLNEEDFFNLVTFSSEVQVWEKESVRASKRNVERAKEFVEGFSADGGTNIFDAMKTGTKLLSESQSSTVLASMLIFLTDGLPTESETNLDSILGGVNKWNSQSHSNIHCIAFGNDADFDFLKKTSIQNRGLARKIFTDSDAASQLQGFYEEISTPLLGNVQLKYLNETLDVNSLVSENNFNYYQGGEMITIGKIQPKLQAPKNGNSSSAGKTDFPLLRLKAEISGRGADGPQKFDANWSIPCYEICPTDSESTSNFVPWSCRDCSVPSKKESTSFLGATLGGTVERSWAYLTIKKLLEKANYVEQNATEQKRLKNEAVKLSLEYNFVNELTSMVVTKPNDENSTVAEISLTSGSEKKRRISDSSPESLVSSATKGVLLTGLAFAVSSGFPLPITEIMATLSSELTTANPQPKAKIFDCKFKTTRPAIYEWKKNYRNATVASRHECIERCFASAFCRVAVYDPTKQMTDGRGPNCLMTYQVYPSCSVPETTFTDDSATVLMYCLDCVKVLPQKEEQLPVSIRN